MRHDNDHVSCFFFDAVSGERVDSDDPIEMDFEEAIKQWAELSREPGSFFGMLCEAMPTVQFLWDDDGITIDIPLPEKRGSLSKVAEVGECRSIIESVFAGSDPTKMGGLHFISWA